MNSTKEITQDEIDSLRWFHQYDFPGGLKARSTFRTHQHFHIAYEKFVIDQLSKIDFQDKSVIDIGCWDGFFSFLAKEWKAASVLGADDYSQNWGAQRCFEIARQLKNSDVDLLPDGNVYTIADKLNGRTFDIVLLLGVFYHLHAPYLALAQVRRLCHENTIVVLEGACYKDAVNPQARIVLSEPHKSKFLPTSKLLADMLRSCYLEPVSEAFISDFTPQELLKYLPPDEVLDLLSKTTRNGKLSDSTEIDEIVGTVGTKAPEPVDRIVVVAKPFSRKNDYHFYSPPFGLDSFDEPQRFTSEQ